MEKAKVKFVKDTKHEDVGIHNGKVFIGFVNIKELKDFLKNEIMDKQEFNKR